MTARLPIPGSDDGTWGDILNGFLSVSHNSDGTLAPGAVTDAGAIANINGKTGVSGAVTLVPSDIGALKAGNNLSDVSSVSTALSNLGAAPLASPALSGIPTAPTASNGTNTTQIATTAFVQSTVNNSSSLLASLAYNTATSNNYILYGNTVIAIDTTNLTVTFTAPSSGKVWVSVDATVFDAAGSGTYFQFLQAATYTAPGAPTVTPTGTAGTTSYYYKVVARFSGGYSAAGSEGSTATGNATLSATNYNALSWTAVSGATGYDIYRGTSPGSENTLVATNVTGTTYNDQTSGVPQNPPSSSQSIIGPGFLATKVAGTRVSWRTEIPGLTGGNSYTIYLGWWSGSPGNSDEKILYYGPTDGPVNILVNAG